MTDAVTNLLIEALAKIRQPSAWTQGAFARPYPAGPHTNPEGSDATCWCSYGVCRSFDQTYNGLGMHRRTVIEAEARLNTWTQANHGLSLEQFNDHPERTQADVVAMFEAAIAAGPLPYQMENQA